MNGNRNEALKSQLAETLFLQIRCCRLKIGPLCEARKAKNELLLDSSRAD
jgi:hypothetical protein